VLIIAASFSQSHIRYVCSASHKDLAGNVFATMDRDLAASSEEGEEKVDSCNDDHRPPELQPDPENSSVAHSDDLASPSYSENPDDASIDKEHDDGDGDASISSGSGESDIESGADNDNGDIASDASGKFSIFCCSLFGILPASNNSVVSPCIRFS